MCGIFGAWNTDGRPVEPDDVVRCRDLLRRRGPDDAGVYVQGAVGLGHRRLAILDLSSAGRMPMASPDGQVQLVYNGEVYNFRELRQELEDLGHRFASRTDSEVVLHAYLAWGTDCFARFQGMFALGLWDARERRLLLARDPLGQKPLYWYRDEGRVLFASTLSPLAAWPGFPRKPDAVALEAYLRYGYVPEPLAAFEGTSKLPPGRFAVFSGDGPPRVERYWDLEALAAEGARVAERPEAEVLDELDALLRDAVRSRMVADVPLGAFLSGGVDSSLVVALMAQASDRVQAYSIGFSSARHDESGLAAETAAHLGVRHTVLTVDQEQVLALVDEVVEAYDEPMADTSALPTLALCHLARPHVTVVLTGDGGDEPFLGYEVYRRLRLARAAERAIPGPARRGLARGLAALIPRPGLSRSVAAAGGADAAAYFGRLGFWRGPVLGGGLQGVRPDLVGEAGAAAEVAAWLRRQPMDVVGAASLYDLTHTLPGAFLHKVDRASMHASLEARNPFMDKRVVEAALRLPARQRLQGMTTKALTRKLLLRYVPPAIVDRPKRGFIPPLGSWLRGELAPTVRELLAEDRVRARGLLDPSGTARVVGEHLSGEREHTQLLWGLIVLERWLERYAA